MPVFKYDNFDFDQYAKVGKVDVCSIFQDLKYQFQGVSQALKVSFIHKVPTKNVFVRGNENRIAEAISSIVHNAFTFCEEGDGIYLSIEVENEWCYIIIQDTGCGIPPTNLERIFEKDFPRRNIQSFSMDLYSVRKHIQKYGGDVWASDLSDNVGENRVILGACFFISLPMMPNHS